MNDFTVERIQEMFQGDVPLPFKRMEIHAAFLSDFYLNFRKFVWDDGYLDQKTKALIAFAVVVHLNGEGWKSWFLGTHLPKLGLPDEAGNDVCAIVATFSMHNAFFKGMDFSGLALISKTHYLRSHTLSCLSKNTVEYIAIVISALNGCHRCTNGHVHSLGAGASEPTVKEAFQCAATMVAGVSFLNSL